MARNPMYQNSQPQSFDLPLLNLLSNGKRESNRASATYRPDDKTLQFRRALPLHDFSPCSKLQLYGFPVLETQFQCSLQHDVVAGVANVAGEDANNVVLARCNVSPGLRARSYDF